MKIDTFKSIAKKKMEKKVAILKFHHHLLLMTNGPCSIHRVLFWYSFNTAALITISINANRKQTLNDQER